jgi:pyruvate/2-oxoglutarate/acetoin dehydrogenase E1 component
MLYMSGGQFGCPVVFRGNDGAGGQLGSTHSWCVEGLYSNVPGVKIVIPSCPADAKGLMKTAIRDDDPVFFLESERMLGNKGHVPEGEYLIPFGHAAVRRAGHRLHALRRGGARELLPRGRGSAREGRHRVRGHRPPHDPSARPADRRRAA